MSILKPTEAIFFVSILIFLDIKLENEKHLFLYNSGHLLWFKYDRQQNYTLRFINFFRIDNN